MNSSFSNFLIVAGTAAALSSCASAPANKTVSNDEARDRAYTAYAEADGSPKGSLREAPKPTTSAACAENGLKGQGVADTYEAALLQAERNIAAQIESSVKSKTESTTRSDTDAEGNEIVQSSYAAQSELLTNLENAQDVKVVSSEEKEGKFSVSACISYADAAVPFKKKFANLQDSVKLGIALFEKLSHPLQKHDAYKKAKAQFVSMRAVSHILKGLGVSESDMTATEASFEQVKMNYSAFRSNFAMYMGDALGSPQQKLLFERFSKNYPVRSSECSNGLKLVTSISPMECKEGSLGLSCSANLSLQGESCNGEAYFSLNAKVKGTGRYDEKEARERLDKNISDGAWFDEWTKELNKWKLD